MFASLWFSMANYKAYGDTFGCRKIGRDQTGRCLDAKSTDKIEYVESGYD